MRVLLIISNLAISSALMFVVLRAMNDWVGISIATLICAVTLMHIRVLKRL